MPTKKLTDLFVERVKPPAQGRVEYFDATFGSPALRVTETGHKSWSLYYRMSGRQRRFTIGAYPAIKPPRRGANRAQRTSIAAVESCTVWARLFLAFSRGMAAMRRRCRFSSVGSEPWRTRISAAQSQR